MSCPPSTILSWVITTGLLQRILLFPLCLELSWIIPVEAGTGDSWVHVLLSSWRYSQVSSHSKVLLVVKHTNFPKIESCLYIPIILLKTKTYLRTTSCQRSTVHPLFYNLMSFISIRWVGGGEGRFITVLPLSKFTYMLNIPYYNIAWCLPPHPTKKYIKIHIRQ